MSGSPPPQARFSAFRYRNFRLFFLGQAVSLCGTWMQAAAQGWLVLSLTDSPFYLGVVAAAGSAPILLFSLFGGVLADRFRKRSLLVLTQGLSIFPAALLGYLTWAGGVQLWHVVALAGILGVVNSLDIPVRQSFLIDLVEPESLHHAIALNSAAFNGARMIGPALAGVIIASAGLHACFLLNAVSYGASLFALYLIHAGKAEKKRHEEGGMIERMREGFRYLRSDRPVISMLAIVMVLSLFGLPYSTLIPAFARDVLGVSSEGYGMLMGAVGMGALAGALALAFRVSGAGAWLIRAAGLIFSLSMISFAFSEYLYLSLFLLFVTGCAGMVVIASINMSIQARVPDRLRGRVMSIYTTLFLGTFPIGSLIMGAVSHWIGVQRSVALGGAVCLAVVIAERLSPSPAHIGNNER